MNVQNIPRDDKVVKRAFVPKLDAFLFADYPNIELKLLAFYLEQIGHPSMAEFFRSGELDSDLHIKTAAGIYDLDPEELLEAFEVGDDTADKRRQVGKKINFSIVYGGGVPTLIDQLGLEPAQALDLLKKFHRTWPGIGWQTKHSPAEPWTLVGRVMKRVQERGYFTTLWGRHLHPRSDHAALNALIQGCAADLMKWACVEIANYLTINDCKTHLVNVVHDDVMLDTALEELEWLAGVLPDLMTYEPVQAVVPIRPTPEVSFKTWADRQPYTKEANVLGTTTAP